MRRCVVGKILHAYIPVEPSSLRVVVAQLDERFAIRTQTRMPYVKDAERLVHTNEKVCNAIETVQCSMQLEK